MTFNNCIAALGVAAAALLPGPTLAGPGHDHGHDHGGSAPAATGPALPRFAAASDLFELVGVLDGRQVTLFLDRAADNAPVTGAQIELEIGGTKFTAEAHDDVYHLTLPAAPQPGVLPVTATVTAGADIDLLASELDIHEAAPADEAAHVHGWQEVAGWAAAATAALVALVVLVLVGRRIAAGRRTGTGAAA